MSTMMSSSSTAVAKSQAQVIAVVPVANRAALPAAARPLCLSPSARNR